MDVRLEVQCCVCRRLRREDDWVVVANPDAYAAAASHGYCPECAQQAFEEIRKARNAGKTYTFPHMLSA